MKYPWFLLTCFVLLQAQEDGDGELWSDPNDPTLIHRRDKNPEKCLQIENKDRTIRLILRQMMHDLHIDPTIPDYIHRTVDIKISKYAMTSISKFLNDDDNDTPEMRENIRSSLSGIFTVMDESSKNTWYDLYTQFHPFIFTLNIVLLPTASVIIFRTLVKPKNFWIVIVSTTILVSMYSGYNKKYQQAEARRLEEFYKNNGDFHDACKEASVFTRFAEVLTSPFVYKQKSDCLKFFESKVVSIISEISIIEVFSETVASGFFSFLSAAGKHINLFFKDLYSGAPVIAQIVMTVFLLLMVGTVRTPFFSYEPLMLTFGSNCIGKIAQWLDGGEEDQRMLKINHEQKMLKSKFCKGEEKTIECPKSEREDERSQEVENCKMIKHTSKEISEHNSDDEECVDSEANKQYKVIK